MLTVSEEEEDSCDCGAEQTADHITTASGRCPVHHPPDGLNDLIELDVCGLTVKTRIWLEDSALDV